MLHNIFTVSRNPDMDIFEGPSVCLPQTPNTHAHWPSSSCELDCKVFLFLWILPTFLGILVLLCSVNKHLPSIYYRQGILLGAGEIKKKKILFLPERCSHFRETDWKIMKQNVAITGIKKKHRCEGALRTQGLGWGGICKDIYYDSYSYQD